MRAAVYPRWRGEHVSLIKTTSNILGLSPLARGTHAILTPKGLECRFIPAGAGNTGNRGGGRGIRPVYPRWRGEHMSLTTFSTGTSGLSPLARGTHRCSGPACCGIRFIPAGAGNTVFHRISQTPTPVYPRWRGEHSPASRRATWISGLSPLARGTQPPVAG